MKLLLFSDLHCNKELTRQIVRQSSEVDLVIGAGDFATVRRGLESSIDILKKITKPVILVPGNNETLDELKSACEGWEVHILHGQGVNILNQEFYGLGGGVPITPFGDWSYDLSESEALEMLKNLPEQAVLISHSPPKGYLDVSSTGKHFGSEAVLKTIRSKQPKLVVCGHIHESAGKIIQLENTIIINAGPKGIIHQL